MNKSEALDYLRKHPVFWSRLGFCYDPPIEDEDGKPLVFNRNFEALQQTHDAFSDAGVRIHTCILHSGWVGVDKYDYSLCDQVLETIFASSKTEYFVPRIKLNVPIEWCLENPTDVFVYEEGPRSVEEISKLIGTLKQDYLGYESEVGYYNAEGWQDPRPNVGGLIALQSFSSEKWLADAGEALRRLILHLEKSPWADRIIAYHIAYGACGESMFWGRQSGKFGDYGITNKERFWEWGIQKYGSYQAVVQAWGSQCEQEIIPPSYLREKMVVSEADLYRDETEDRWSLDYDLFNCKVNTDALIHFGKIVKENTRDKLVGCFYGYLLHMPRCAYTGFLGWQRLLESEYVDFYAAPKSYFRCGAGEPGGVMAPTVSINHRRLWVDECDNRTHLAKGFDNTTCLEETYAVLLREVCKNISHNSGFWFMDLGGGWYDDDDIMECVASLVKASAVARKRTYRSVAQIAIIVDESSILHTHPDITCPTENWIRNFQLTGAPIDIIFSDDIDKIDLSGIQLAVLLNPVCIGKEYMERLRQRIAEEAYILICQKTAVSEEMTGNVMFSTLDATVKELRDMVECAGVNCYAPAECTVYADNRIVSFFPRQDMEFVPSLPEKLQLTNLISGEVYQQGSILRMEAKRGIAFMCND